MNKGAMSADVLPRVMAEAHRRLSPARLRHVERVVTQARALAERFGADVDAVMLAAWSHDLDREAGAASLLAYASDFALDLTALERREPILLHGPVAAHRLGTRFGVEDSEVLHAVRHHTLGHPELGTVGKILYAADYCEPGRSHLSEAERASILAGQTVDALVIKVIANARRRFGTLEEPTEHLYARLQKESW